jgi:hypothetical protein
MRPALASLAALALGLSVSGCGDDDKKKGGASGAKTASFEMTGSGKKVKLSGPDSIEAGAVRVEFKNGSKDTAGVQLVRIEGRHTAAEAIKVAQAWGDGGKPLADWVRLVGGIAEAKPGSTSSSVQALSAGNYAGVDIGTNEYAEFEVTGGDGAEPPSTSARIEAVDYSFKATGLEAGKGQVEFVNKGKQPHFALAAPIKPGKTIEDVRAFLKQEKGASPTIEQESLSTGILDGGRSEIVEMKLRKGKIAMLCFAPDREGGPPHAFKGMVSEGVVR